MSPCSHRRLTPPAAKFRFAAAILRRVSSPAQGVSDRRDPYAEQARSVPRELIRRGAQGRSHRRHLDTPPNTRRASTAKGLPTSHSAVPRRLALAVAANPRRRSLFARYDKRQRASRYGIPPAQAAAMPRFTFTRAICEVFEQICLNYLDEVTAPTLVLCGCPQPTRNAPEADQRDRERGIAQPPARDGRPSRGSSGTEDARNCWIWTPPDDPYTQHATSA